MDAEEEAGLERRPLVEVPFAGCQIGDLRKRRERDPCRVGPEAQRRPRGQNRVLDLAVLEDVLFTGFDPDVERGRDLHGRSDQRSNLLLHLGTVSRLLPPDFVDAVQDDKDRADALVEQQLSFELCLLSLVKSEFVFF